MTQTISRLFLVGFFAILVACASAPTWEDMSQQEISDWKALAFDAETAQAWKEEGFTPATAAVWSGAGFNLETAAPWRNESFTAEETTSWIEGGFDLDQAIKNRATGLTPVPEADAVETTE